MDNDSFSSFAGVVAVLIILVGVAALIDMATAGKAHVVSSEVCRHE